MSCEYFQLQYLKPIICTQQHRNTQKYTRQTIKLLTVYFCLLYVFADNIDDI